MSGAVHMAVTRDYINALGAHHVNRCSRKIFNWLFLLHASIKLFLREMQYNKREKGNERRGNFSQKSLCISLLYFRTFKRKYTLCTAKRSATKRPIWLPTCGTRYLTTCLATALDHRWVLGSGFAVHCGPCDRWFHSSCGSWRQKPRTAFTFATWSGCVRRVQFRPCWASTISEMSSWRWL
jgi:hypothetical protein